MLESELEKHKAKCPAYKLRLAEQSQPCFQEGVNEGPGPEVTLPETSSEFADSKGRTDTPSVRRAAYAAGLGQEGFAQLLDRIDQAYEQVGGWGGQACCGQDGVCRERKQRGCRVQGPGGQGGMRLHGRSKAA